ncbi:(+)-neomenthol dehydrogenase isoform X2 [Telopea speciosissima]|uniref:(+)-neomenthol dehydrogenase isoform X2 n=1 Tax=Telopea speciosissima TaxID=54955 RepID=UPI001CC7C0B1|nr:(+)-neomenthol dehydrogenase isoform X2 [Telopea speciosissima]
MGSKEIEAPTSPSPLSSSSTRWWSKETVAVVTGANKGIGYAFVKRLAELGLTVILTSRDVLRGQNAIELLRAQGLDNVHFFRLDVTDPALIHAFVSWLRDKYGGLDILVNNAGVSFNEIGENSLEHAETVIKTNYYGTKLFTEALLPLFRRSSSLSRILNISSQLGQLNVKNPTIREELEDEEKLSEEGIENVVRRFFESVRKGTWKEEGWPSIWTDYSVSKIALNAYSRLLAKRYKEHGLIINCYCPGFTRTAMTRDKGNHTADVAADLGTTLLLLPHRNLPTGKFYSGVNPVLNSKL